MEDITRWQKGKASVTRGLLLQMFFIQIVRMSNIATSIYERYCKVQIGKLLNNICIIIIHTAVIITIINFVIIIIVSLHRDVTFAGCHRGPPPSDAHGQ